MVKLKYQNHTLYMAVITKLSKQNFSNILSHYSVGSYVSHKHVSWALQNTLYILKTTTGDYVLKIFENASFGFVAYQTKVIRLLADSGIPVAVVCKTKDEREILSYKNKKMAISKLLPGSHPKKFTDALVRDIAKKMALMNSELLKIKPIKNREWPKDHQFSKAAGKKDFKNFDFKKEEKTLLRDLKSVDKNKLRRGLVHGDFHGVNLLIKNDKLTAVLDWDDAHEDYLVHEIAVFIMDSFISRKKVEKNKIKTFFVEYQKRIILNEEEEKAIYFLVKQRFLGVILWHREQMERHLDMKNKLQKQMNSLIQDYIIFKKISLAEFIELTR